MLQKDTFSMQRISIFFLYEQSIHLPQISKNFRFKILKLFFLSHKDIMKFVGGVMDSCFCCRFKQQCLHNGYKY